MKKCLWLVSIIAVTTGCAVFPEVQNVKINESKYLENMSAYATYDIEIGTDQFGPDKLKQMKLTQELRYALKNNKDCNAFNQDVRNADNFDRDDSILRNGYKATKICFVASLLRQLGDFRINDPGKTVVNNFNLFLDIKIKETGPNSFFYKSWMFLSFVSIAIVPYREETEVDISIDVYKDNSFLKTYQVNGKSVFWMQIALLPYMPFSKKSDDLYDNLIKRLLSVMNKEGVFLAN